MLRSVCAGIDPVIVDMYDMMIEMVQSDAASAAMLAELFQEKDKNVDRPKAFYQVGRDRPPGLRQPCTCTCACACACRMG